MNASRQQPPPATPGVTAIAPPRLLAGGGSAFERRLLESAATDEPSEVARWGLAARLRLGEGQGEVSKLDVPGAIQSGPSGLAGPVPRHLTSVRWWPVGMLALMGFFGAGAWLHGLPASSPLGSAASGSAQPDVPLKSIEVPGDMLVAEEAPAQAPLTRGTTASAPDSAAATGPVREPWVAPGEARRPAPLKRPTLHRRNSVREQVSVKGDHHPGAVLRPPAPSLSEEVQALDRVRKSIASGNSANAKAQLEQYFARFTRGELRLEAEVLQIDVAVAQGQHVAAQELAHALLLQPEAARYRARLQNLLAPPIP